ADTRPQVAPIRVVTYRHRPNFWSARHWVPAFAGTTEMWIVIPGESRDPASSSAYEPNDSMTDLITQAENRLLRPGGLSANDLDRVFARLTGPSIDAADLYFQHSRSESWVLEDGIVKEGNHSIEQGVGVRALSGEKTGFAYSDDIVLPQLLEAAGAARAIANDGNGAGKPLSIRGARALYPAEDPIDA